MELLKSVVVLAGCLILSAALPTNPTGPLPVLKDQPEEVLFKADNYSTVLLECTTENKDKDVKYSWYKDGALFDWEAAGHIGQRRGEGSIMFFNPKPSDEGVYRCLVETPYGTASTRPISLKRTFLNAPTKIEAKEHSPVFGKPYKLECPIPQSYPKPTISWKTQLRSDPSIIEDILNRRITLSPDGTLWFSNVTETDVSPSFKYICVAKTPASRDDVILAEHFLKTLVEDEKPNDGELVPQYLSNDMMAKAGDITMIYCIYGGTPLGFPDWSKEGKNVDGKPGDRITSHNRTSGKRLLIKDTRIEDQGTYTCDVFNGVGKKQTHSMKLTVVSAPKFLEKIEKQLDAKATNDIEIPCKIAGLPEPKVTWTYNGKPIESSQYKNGVLPIHKVKKANSGYYGCKAENEHGVIYAETLVNVVPLGIPDWFKDGKDVNGKPGDRITRHNRTSGKRLLIKDTQLEDQGTYTCEVNNGVGRKHVHNVKLTVVSAPQFAEKLEKQLNVKTTENIEVPCKVTGLPAPKVTWTYNGQPFDSPQFKNGVLSVAKVKKGHSGYYGCKAENEHGVIYAETLVSVL